MIQGFSKGSNSRLNRSNLIHGSGFRCSQPMPSKGIGRIGTHKSAQSIRCIGVTWSLTQPGVEGITQSKLAIDTAKMPLPRYPSRRLVRVAKEPGTGQTPDRPKAKFSPIQVTASCPPTAYSSYDVLLDNSCAGFNCIVVLSLLLMLGAAESALRQSLFRPDVTGSSRSQVPEHSRFHNSLEFKRLLRSSSWQSACY